MKRDLQKIFVYEKSEIVKRGCSSGRAPSRNQNRQELEGQLKTVCGEEVMRIRCVSETLARYC